LKLKVKGISKIVVKSIGKGGRGKVKGRRLKKEGSPHRPEV